MFSKVIEHYKKLPQTIKAAIWFVVASFLQNGISFLTVPFFTRLLSTEQYGQYSLYQTWYQFIYIFGSLNLAAGVYNKGLVKYEKERHQFTSSIQCLSSLCCIVVFIVYLLFRNPIESYIGLPTIVMLFMFAEVFFAPAFTFWLLQKKFDFKYVLPVIIVLIMSALSPLLCFGLVSLTAEKGVARIVGVSLVNVSFGLIFYIINCVKGRVFLNKKYWGYALRFNLPLIPHYLSSIVLAQSDRIMIDKRFGESFVAKYAVSYSIASIINIFVTSVNSIFIPWTYQKCAKEDYRSIRTYSNYLLIIIGTICLCPILIAPEIMSIMAPSDYSDAVYVIPPVSLSVYFIFLYTLFCNIEFAFEYKFFTMLSSIIAGVSNIVLNLLFMQIYGYIAAAYTTLLCYMILSIAHFVAYKIICRKKSIKSIYNTSFMLVFSLFLIAITFSLLFIFELPRLRFSLFAFILFLAFLSRNKIKNLFLRIKTN